MTNGLWTWRSVIRSLGEREISDLHTNALKFLDVSKNTTVSEKLNSVKQQEMIQNKIPLHTMFTSIQYLARQGRGLSTNGKYNLHQLLVARAENVPQLENWLSREGFKWILYTSVN